MELAPDLAIVMVAVQVLRELGRMAQDRDSVPPALIGAFLSFATATDRACGWPLRIVFLRNLGDMSIEEVVSASGDGSN